MMTGRRELVGVVTASKMQKTIVVEVRRRKVHRKLGKVLTQRERFMAHDEKGECQTGDEVLIVESRPLSRWKRWRVLKVLKKGIGVMNVEGVA